MTTLSPSAQAVLDAFLDTPGEVPMPMWDYGRDLAAALEAFADQIMPMTPEPKCAKPTAEWHRWNVTGALRLNLLSIAAELRAQ